MATGLGRASAVCLVTLLFVNISQSAHPANALGDPCQDDRTCEIPNSYCRPLSKTCECKSGHTHNTNKDNCIKLPEKSSIGSHCISDDDCVFTEEASRCSDNVCRRCAEGSETEFSECQERIGGCSYHEYNGHCFKYRRLGEPCEVNEDCWIYTNSNKTRHCSSAICLCAEGYDAMSGPLPAGQEDQCLKKEGGAGAATSSCFSTMVLLMLVLLMSNWS